LYLQKDQTERSLRNTCIIHISESREKSVRKIEFKRWGNRGNRHRKMKKKALRGIEWEKFVFEWI